MGVDKNLYSNGKYICSFGRAYRFQDLYTEQDIEEFVAKLVAKMHWPMDYEEMCDQVMDFSRDMRGFVEECKRLGAKELVDYVLIEDGLEVKDE
jgi:hypothetical protein